MKSTLILGFALCHSLTAQTKEIGVRTAPVNTQQPVRVRVKEKTVEPTYNNDDGINLFGRSTTKTTTTYSTEPPVTQQKKTTTDCNCDSIRKAEENECHGIWVVEGSKSYDFSLGPKATFDGYNLGIGGLTCDQWLILLNFNYNIKNSGSTYFDVINTKTDSIYTYNFNSDFYHYKLFLSAQYPIYAPARSPFKLRVGLDFGLDLLYLKYQKDNNNFAFGDDLRLFDGENNKKYYQTISKAGLLIGLNAEAAVHYKNVEWFLQGKIAPRLYDDGIPGFDGLSASALLGLRYYFR